MPEPNGFIYCHECGNNVRLSNFSHSDEMCITCANLELGEDVEDRDDDVVFNVHALEFFPGQPSLRNRSRRFLGAEIEVAGIEGKWTPLGKKLNEWKTSVVDDGSLPDSGFEMRLQPASGSEYVRQIESICDSLQQAQAYVDRSCGLHVHIDARDLSPYCLRKVVLGWEVVEPYLQRLIPFGRRTSTYARPLRDAIRTKMPDPKEKREVRRDVRENLMRGDRYRTLNLTSLARHNTLEVRMHEGTVKAEDIGPWGVLCASIVDWTGRTGEQQLREYLTARLTLEDRREVLDKWVIRGNDYLSEYIERRYTLYNSPATEGRGEVRWCTDHETFHTGEGDINDIVQLAELGYTGVGAPTVTTANDGEANQFGTLTIGRNV